MVKKKILARIGCYGENRLLRSSARANQGQVLSLRASPWNRASVFPPCRCQASPQLFMTAVQVSKNQRAESKWNTGGSFSPGSLSGNQHRQMKNLPLQGPPLCHKDPSVENSCTGCSLCHWTIAPAPRGPGRGARSSTTSGPSTLLSFPLLQTSCSIYFLPQLGMPYSEGW